jgi:ATP-dependent Clp protease ATP-binding subunit ClpA
MTLKELRRRANEVADELGHAEICTEHFVLALLHPLNESPASEALRSCGISYHSVVEEVARLPTSVTAPQGRVVSSGGGRGVTPLAIRVLARADGIAVGMGSDVRPEHLLLSILWDDVASPVHRILDRQGATRKRILTALSEGGTKVPHISLPKRRRWSEFRPLSPAEYEHVRNELTSTGTRYRVAHKGTQILLSVEQGLGSRDS